ncbi:zwei Ig domain protein zig-4-like [Uloborus diversus]|uniref:zwei Ig domain protein zig-4-like n=1 Tax=Uloborus diversus TaxID=327109 RepID=UPI00240A2B03|nr:zwei Ig domain protein zig-4-like [Uloborus diversus]XP_054713264.1 zwei Ig domain protein zig-4-like [Uloborus diversus]XP_054713265.1 zwei Ig domain protein zig-4-like [Uloborus diversus]XP_054713266.1 zwei Ig domain protein zig-4-like [Uloborus diversus]
MQLNQFAVFLLLAIISEVFGRHLNKNSSRRHEGGEESSRTRKSHLRLHAKPPKTIHVTEGDDRVIECQAGGRPAPSVHWLKNGKKISQNDAERFELVSEVATEEDGDTSKLNIGSVLSRLFLDCISEEDEAEYTCVAENAYHRTSSTTQVVVSLSEEKKCEERGTYGHAPRIYSWTKTMLETQGLDTKLICKVDGFPQPTIKWYLALGSKREELNNGDKYQISKDGSLVIRNLKWSDMGNYICTADNIHGTAKSESFLYPAIPES